MAKNFHDYILDEFRNYIYENRPDEMRQFSQDTFDIFEKAYTIGYTHGVEDIAELYEDSNS